MAENENKVSEVESSSSEYSALTNANNSLAEALKKNAATYDAK